MEKVFAVGVGGHLELGLFLEVGWWNDRAGWKPVPYIVRLTDNKKSPGVENAWAFFIVNFWTLAGYVKTGST